MKQPIHKDDTAEWLLLSFVLIVLMFSFVIVVGKYAESRAGEPPTQTFSK